MSQMTQTFKNLNPDNVNLTTNMLEIYYKVLIRHLMYHFY